MNITTLLNQIRDAIKNSSAIAAWCVANYGQVHTLAKGMDERDPLAEASYPAVCVFQAGRRAGYQLEAQENTIAVNCGIHDTSKTTSTVELDEGDDSVIEFSGIDNIEAFRKLVENEITALVIGNGDVIEELNVEYDPIESFPFFIARQEFRISHDYSQGDDPFE